MENFASYCVLSGKLSPGESIIVQALFKSPQTAMKLKSIRNLLRKSGITNFPGLFESIETKELAKVTKNTISLDWDGLRIFLNSVKAEISDISHEIFELTKMIENEKISEQKTTDVTDSPLSSLGIGTILTNIEANKQSISENTLLEACKATVMDGIGILEGLEEIGLVRIKQNKRSRTIKPTAEGSAVRYLFDYVQGGNVLNKVQYNYLDALLLEPHGLNWQAFLARINSSEALEDAPNWLIITKKLLLELGILISDEKAAVYDLVEPSSDVIIKSPTAIKNFVSGFVPVYVSNLFDVLMVLQDNDNKVVTKKNLSEKTGLGPTSISGIVSMLDRFKLIDTSQYKTKGIFLTKEGKQAVQNGELEQFERFLKSRLKEYEIFSYVLEFTEARGGEIGFLDLSGFFRSNGVPNFNPAKAMSILRLMNLTNYGLERSPDTSGFYRIKK